MILITQIIKKLKHKKFKKLSYNDRVKLIKSLHKEDDKINLVNGYLEKKAFFLKVYKTYPRIVDDLVVSSGNIFKFDTFLQLGCWHLFESKLLLNSGFLGKIIASDYSSKYVDYLKKISKNSFFKKISFKKIDIENISLNCLKKVEFVSAVQVLSNIQPEGMKNFFKVLNKSKVKLLIIGDMYSNRSLGYKGKTILSDKNLNWYHPYEFLAKKNGFNFIFLPDCNLSDNDEKRGIFIIYRKIVLKKLLNVIDDSTRSFIKRQNEIRWTK